MNKKLQYLLIGLLMLALVAMIILFWGSIASMLCVFLLILVPCEVLIKKFIVDREASDYDDYN